MGIVFERDGGRAGALGREAQGWFRALVERAPAVFYVDASEEVGGSVYMSPRAEAMLGYRPEEWLADRGFWGKILHPEDRERVLDAAACARANGKPFGGEYRLLHRDGRAVWVRDEAVPVPDGEGRPGWWQGVLVDVTGRREAEAALERSEERFRLVAKATGEAIWDNDLTTGIQEWDGATEALFGYPPHVGRTGAWWEERIHPEDRGRVLSGLERVLTPEGGEVWGEGYRFRKADGTYAHVSDRGHVVRDESGKPLRMVGSMRDVTEKKRHKEELKRSEELFRTAFEAAAVGMAHVAPDGRWLEINRKLCDIVGYPREELLRTSFWEMTPPEERAAASGRVRRLLAEETGPYTVERRYIRKDGSRVWVKLTVSLVRKASGEPDFLICVVGDITEQKIAELVPDPLSCKEMEVLRLVAWWLTNRQISQKLNYSESMIKSHIHNILAKLGVSTRRQAAARAVAIGLIPPPR